MQSFLVQSQEGDSQQRRFFFVDESSLASTDQMRDSLRKLGPEGRLLLIGDTRQHQGVEAGRPFQQLQEAGMQTAKLDQIVRQRDPGLKAEVELLAVGQTTAAIQQIVGRSAGGSSRRIPSLALGLPDFNAFGQSSFSEPQGWPQESNMYRAISWRRFHENTGGACN